MNGDDGSSLLEITRRKTRSLTILSEYSSAANNLPDWAKEILESNMGSIRVNASDSFWIFLGDIGNISPKYEYELFFKKFMEIFENNAQITLKSIQKNREDKLDQDISNDLFWNEFTSLFKQQHPLKIKFMDLIYGIVDTIKSSQSELIEFLSYIRDEIREGNISGALKKLNRKQYIPPLNPNLIHGK